MSKLWQRITYHRHRSELWALCLAKQVPLLAMLPIGLVICFWWGVAVLPVLIPIVLLMEILGPIGEVVPAVLGIPSLIALYFFVPWFFGWYWIALSLMFGRFTAAKAKENALAQAIHVYRVKLI